MLELMTKKKNIILIGGGGHCISCIDVIESSNEFSIAGIVDNNKKIGDDIMGYPVIGADVNLPELREKFKYAIITVGQIKTSSTRVKIYNKLKNLDYELPVVVAKTAMVSQHSYINEGSIIMHHAIINANSTVGKNCIINTKALIEHDNQIGDNCHISTNSTLNGTVKVGNNCFIGSNTKTSNNISIGDNIFIGINSLVTKDLNEPGVYLGSPVRKIK